MFKDMDEKVVKEICKHMKHMTYRSGTLISEKHKPLEMMFVLLNGPYVSISAHPESTLPSYPCYDGDFYGLELVHWITNWVSHPNFPAKLPLSLSSATVSGRKECQAEVAVILADDLKRIVCEFRSDFMKTVLPIDLQETLATFDTFTMVKKVPILENMDEDVLKAICSHLKPIKYSNDTPDGAFIMNPGSRINKMLFLIRGLVCHRLYMARVSYLYPGNYFGEELLKWVLDASVDSEPMLSTSYAYHWVGEGEAFVLMAEDLAKVIFEFPTHFVRQITTAFQMDSHSDSDSD